MQVLESIRRKIESAEDLHSVVKTMKTLAAVNIHTFERAVRSVNNYFHNIEDGLQVILKQNSEILRSDAEKKEDTIGIIVFGAQRGLAGNFNLPVSTMVSDWIQEKEINREHSLLVCSVGEKIVEQLKVVGVAQIEQLDFPTFQFNLDYTIQILLLMIESWRFERNVDLIQIFYNKPVGGTTFQPFTNQLFPLDIYWLKGLAKRKWASHSIPLYTIKVNKLFNQLVRQYLYISIYRAFLESMASENISRLIAMQKAEQSIEERLDDLNTLFHQQRQNAITEELLDIIAGFEAITK